MTENGIDNTIFAAMLKKSGKINISEDQIQNAVNEYFQDNPPVVGHMEVSDHVVKIVGE